jgi:hypothetical protein
MMRVIIMKKFGLIISVLLLSSSVVQAASISGSQIEYWRELVQRDLSEILSEASEGLKYDWPEVHSVDYASPQTPEARQYQNELRSVAVQLVRKLARVSENLPSLPRDQFYSTIKSLLSLRDQVGRRPTYVNCVLADTINRVVWINLVKRLQIGDGVPAELASLVDHLGLYKTSVDTLVKVVERELGESLVDDQEVKQLTQELIEDWDRYRKPQGRPLLDAPEIERFRAVGVYHSALRTLERERSNEDPLSALPESLVDSAGFSWFLRRHAVSDLNIQTALPLAVLYKRTVGQVTEADDHAKVKAVLGEKLDQQRSWGAEVLYGRLGLEDAVWRVFYKARIGDLDNQLMISKPQAPQYPR